MHSNLHSILLFSNVIDPPPSPLAKNLRKHGCLLPSCIFNPTVYYTPPIFISHTFSLGSLKPTAVQPQGLLGVTTCLRLCLYAFLLEFCCYAMQCCGLRNTFKHSGQKGLELLKIGLILDF